MAKGKANVSSSGASMSKYAVEVAVVDSSGYRFLDREDVNKQIDRLKPLEE